MQYSFGIPGHMIWITHIIIGFILAYIGFVLLNGKHISQIFIVGLIVIGSLAILYHTHLFYYYAFNKQINK